MLWQHLLTSWPLSDFRQGRLSILGDNRLNQAAPLGLTHPSTLTELRRAVDARPWMVTLVLPPVDGGKATLADLEQLPERPDATAIQISGLDQRMFERLVAEYGRQFRGLYLWKCPRITDLSPIQDLPQLTHVACYWNQRATRLWDLSATPNLRGLHFEDFTRLTALDDLAAGASLEELRFGNAVWVTSVYATLDPLVALGGLRDLDFTAKRVIDGRIQPLAHLVSLTRLSFPTNLFTTEQCAWLRARLPDSVTGPILQPIKKLSNPIPGTNRDSLVIGKGKPFLSSAEDAARIARYEADFLRMVDLFRLAPDRDPAATHPRVRH